MQVESAIQAYKRGKHYMEASDLYEEQKEYLDSIQILIDHKLYVEAASKARKLENSGMSLSNDLSSISVAKKHIKKYCKPKWQHKAEKNTFYGLLHHIPAKEEKVTYIKYAKRFTEALEMHFESQEYAKFYRLILAQGPGVMLSTTTLTYYDCGLHLSSVCGHFAMHKTLVINSARSCTKSSGSLPPRVFNELENLSQPDFVDIKTRLNALLLLAKHNDSRIQEAIYVSDLYSCLPFDVELGLLRLKDKENPLSYFIQLAYKVLYLLSLSSDVLAAAYEDILGIHKSKTDQLYLKQERYAKDLGYEFVSDCYLLSHDSQDIWIQTLTKSEDVTKDIDGMWIIPTKIIFTEVKTHLKKVLEKLLTHCFKCEMLLRSPLWKIVKGEIRVSGSTFYPNPVPIRYHLEMYCLVLHSIHLCDSKYRDESIQMLRQYHSIRMSCYFPLCVNFISWKEHIIGKRAWSLLQSQTKKWIDSHVVETARFNFLRLWEQASITDLTQTLKNNLDRLVQTETKHEPLDTEALSCYKTALKWIQVCEEVIIDPLQNCHIFFRNILPQFIALKFDLRGVIDSISIYGTITLALISYVTPSLESSIIVPHMYARALSVYDSLLPKEKRQQNVLNSCCNPNYIKRSTQLSSIRHALVQYLPSALKQIELLLLNEPFKKYSDLLRVISILMLTLYINYVLLAPTSPEIPKFHSRLARCLKQQILKLTHKKSTKEKGSLLYVCTAFHEAETASNLLEILKYLLRPSYVTHNEYESLAVITCSKDHDKIYIEPNEDILLPYAPIVSGKVMMKGDFYIPCEATPLLPEESRKQYLSFRLHQYGELYLIWTSPSSSLAWMHYDECGEEVKQCLQEFILIVLKEGFLSDQPAIAGKSLLQQLLHLPEADITECLGRLKYPQPGWI